MKFRIKGRVIMNKQKSVLVTGAASGIGRCIVDYLRERGDYVFACDVNERGLEDLDGLERVTAIKMDV
ncbi:MAG: SDR family NAD(P)-dependent oxidoreductase, partial [Candidatus Omnitrophica bacterium]|nr:SDR family NAD(P)-dependent oxidoreductase [Candidatus Omnitrophota bacterium]